MKTGDWHEAEMSSPYGELRRGPVAILNGEPLRARCQDDGSFTIYPEKAPSVTISGVPAHWIHLTGDSDAG